MTVADARTSGSPSELKCSCAEVWAHPAARLLFGDALRPGGRDLTAELVDRAGIERGDRILDVGSGTGATLALLRERGATGVGVDYSATLATAAAEHGAVGVGDGEALPFDSGAFDAVMVECVLSALPGKDAAASELRRVLRAGGCLVVSDVVVGGSLPEPLDGLLGWLACTAGALAGTGYAALLEAAGFELLEVADRRDAMAELVAKARRRVALLRAAARVGLVSGPEELLGGETSAILANIAPVAMSDDVTDLDALGQQVLAQAAAAVDDGRLGYMALVARAR